jgi:hypothetical protein
VGEEGETQVVAGADAVQADQGLVSRDIWLLRLRALLARAHGDAAAYANFRDRYRGTAKTLGFEGISRGASRCHDRAELGLWAAQLSPPNAKSCNESAVPLPGLGC